MSDSEEENYCFFGKPLEPYDEDAFPKKKPISVEEQIATDAQGRRRFHGAFTGGFSAGFYNTVGSLEGWTPSEFKSTRQEKAQGKSQKPEDFMDDEDMGEFGIAPQTVRATSDYSTSKKRKKQVFSDGPIPGEPVLHTLLTSGNETIGYLLLKNIGLKNKAVSEGTENIPEEKVYGCEMPKTYEISRSGDVNQYAIPDIYKEFLQKPKSNTFGLGYEGLDKSHINLFKSSKLVIQDRNKKKLSISGQAFGVGAFEDDDEDIYVREDMSRYDFELTGEKVSKKEGLQKNEETIFDDFVVAKTPLTPKETYPLPTIPHSFTGKHKIKRSRFEPLPEETESVDRRDMNPEIRARYLGEEVNTAEATPSTSRSNNIVTSTPSSVKQEVDESNPTPETKSNAESQKATNLFSVSSSSLIFDRFVSASTSEDVSDILEPVKPSESTHGSQEMRDAARMKMFGPLTRITTDWQPCSLLCKRFNVPEPHFDELNASKSRKRTKNLIFEYEKYSDTTPFDFKPGLSVKETDEIVEEEKENNNANTTQNNTEVENTSVTVDTSNEESKANDRVSTTKDTPAENETPKDITDKIDVTKNIDLFRAVFLSSSESEDEKDEEEEKNKAKRDIEMKSSILSDNLLPKIKPIKEGILSNMDFSIFEKPQEPNVERNVNKDNETISDLSGVKSETSEPSYGPCLPEKLSSSTYNTSSMSSTSHQERDDMDEWVEKRSDGKKHKDGHKKKHKNKKSSHKKKHKHKRD